MSVHVIGAANRRYETGPMPVFEHRSATSGPALRQYGDDWSLSLGRRLRRLGSQDICVIHQAVEASGSLAHRAARNSRVILVQHGANPLGWDVHLAAATRIVVLREDLTAELRTHSTDPAQIVTMTPSIDRDLFRPMDREFDENGTVTLGFVGHVTRPKGAFEIPNMLAHLVPNGVDARVEYAGTMDSDGEELRSALASAEVEQRVDFLGRMSNAQIAQRMRGWRLMLAPSYGEGYGRAILEAFVTRVPVAVVAGVVPAELECRPGVGAATRIDYPQLVLKMLRDPRRPPPGDWIPGHDRGAIAWDQLIDALPPEPSQNQPPPLLAMRLRRIRRLRPLQRAEYHAKRRVRQLLTHSHPHACG